MQGVKTPCAFNQHVLSNFFKSLKIRTAWRKDFFDTLRRPVWPPGTGCDMFQPRWLLRLGTDARCAPLRVVRSAGVHRTSNCDAGGHTGRPYGSASLGAVNGGAVGVDTQRADVGIGPYGLASGPGGAGGGKIRHHRTIVSAAFAQSFAPSVQL